MDMFILKNLSQIKLKVETFYSHDRAFIVVLLFSTLIRIYGITLPYGKPWETTFQEVIARNHVVYGFSQTNFISVISVFHGENIYHLGHPPLLQILVSISYFLFGIHEWSARFVPLLFSLGSIILFYLLVQKIRDKKTSMIASFFMSFIPMSAYFGRIVGFEPITMFFVLMVVYCYFKFILDGDKKYYLFAIGGTILGSLSDWPFYLILPILVMISLLSDITRRKIKYAFVLLLLGGAIFSLYNLYSYILTNDMIFFAHLKTRSSTSVYMDVKFYLRVWYYLVYYITPIPVLFSFAYIITNFRRKYFKYKMVDVRNLIPLSLIIFGVSTILTVPRHVFVHPFNIYYLVPGLSFLTALGINQIYNSAYDKSLKILVIVLILLLFVFSSQSTMFDLHKNRYSTFYYEFGEYINKNTNEDDTILSLGMFEPVLFYANRSFPQDFYHGFDSEIIAEVLPKFIFYPPSGGESNRNTISFENFLISEGYVLMLNRPYVKAWRFSDENENIFNANSVKPIKISDGVSEGYDLIITLVDSKIVFYAHPISSGFVNLDFDNVVVKNNSVLTFSIALSPKVWSDTKGDGVLFEIYLNNMSKNEKLFSKYIDPKNNISDRKWHDFELPLDKYAGNNVTISFVTSSGPKNDNSYDWAYWGEPKIIVKIPNNNSAS